MNLNHFKLFILFSIISFYGWSQKNKSKTKQLNIIFISIDDMNNWIGPWKGIADTPNIDILAKEGIAFKNAHCVAPSCNPSRTSLFTGQRPETTKVYGNFSEFRKKEGGKDRITLPQFLQAKGYETVAAGKLFHDPRGTETLPNPKSDPESWNFQLKVEKGTPWDYSYHDENESAKWLNGATEFEGHEIVKYSRKTGIWGPIKETKEMCGDWKVAQFGADFLQKKHEKPFFLGLGIFKPHAPLLAPKEYFDRYPLKDIKLPNIPLNDMEDVPKNALANFSTGFAKKVKSDTIQWKKGIQAYLACTSFADDCVGQILKGLKKSKYKNNTIVVFWTDHGWQLGHKDRWEKHTLWHQSTNAPLIIKVPNQTHKTAIQEHVSLLDIYPTITDLLGYKKPAFLEGNSLVPFLKNSNPDWKHKAVVTSFKSHSVTCKDWNYIRYGNGTEELYNHAKDPDEWHNVANDPKNKDIIKELKKAIPAH